MIKCLNQKRLNLERSKLFFYLSFACVASLGAIGKYLGSFDKIFSGNFPPFPDIIFETTIFILAWWFFSEAIHYYMKQED